MSNPNLDVFTPDSPPPFSSWPSLFALQVHGTCCEPIIPNGANCIFNQDASYVAGDFVVFWGLTASGVIKPLIKRLVMNVADWGTLPHKPRSGNCVVPVLVYETLTPPQVFRTDLRAVWGIQKCVGYAPHSSAEIGDSVPYDDADVHWFDRPVLKKPRRAKVARRPAAGA